MHWDVDQSGIRPCLIFSDSIALDKTENATIKINFLIFATGLLSGFQSQTEQECRMPYSEFKKDIASVYSVQ